MKHAAVLVAIVTMLGCSSNHIRKFPDGAMEIRNREMFRSHSTSTVSPEGVTLEATAQARGLEALTAASDWVGPLVQALAPLVGPFLGRALALQPAEAGADDGESRSIAPPSWQRSAEPTVWLNPGAEAWHWRGCRFVGPNAEEVDLSTAVETRRKCRTCGEWSGPR